MSLNIVLADDSIAIQKVVQITLGSNYQLQICSGNFVENLFDRLQASRVQMVLLDFNLSKSKSGYDLVKEIKSTSPATEVILFFSDTDDADEAQVEACGAKGSLVKPFDSSALVSECKRVAESFGHQSDEDKSDWEIEVPGVISQNAPEGANQSTTATIEVSSELSNNPHEHTPPFQGTETDTQVFELEKQIGEAEDLWNAEVEAKKAEVTADITEQIVEANLHDQVEAIVEKVIEEKFKATIEKIAWEVIPDLAENLIKKELDKISDSIIEEGE